MKERWIYQEGREKGEVLENRKREEESEVRVVRSGETPREREATFNVVLYARPFIIPRCPTTLGPACRTGAGRHHCGPMGPSL